MSNPNANKELKELLKKYLRGDASVEEAAFVEEYYAYFDKDVYNPEIMLPEEQSALGRKIFFQLSKRVGGEALITKDFKSVADGLTANAVSSTHRIHFLRTAWFRYAAAILIIAVAITAVVLLTNYHKRNDIVTVVETPDNIKPGGDKAILTLANGKQIILDNAANGNLAQQGNTKIIKLNNGQLAYQTSLTGGTKIEQTTSYNTIRTPRGGQYQIVLPDGTKVWLNAASSIKFPAAFLGSSREVEIEGEAYLEVVKNSKQPFTARANGTEIQVLGTSFNINAYKDEEMTRTTLISGSIKVLKENRDAVLKPGEQARVTRNKNIYVTSDMDVDQEIAWKNGYFNLRDANLSQVMKQLERWYDIEVKYEGQIADLHFQGKINRGVKLSSVLDWFSTMGIDSRLEGRRVTLSVR